MKHRPPFFFRLQVHKVLSIKEAGVIRAVVRTPHLTGAVGDFWKRAKHDSRLIGDPDAFVRPRARRKRIPYPEGTFIQVWQKFGTDDAAECEVTPNRHHQRAYSDCDRAAANRPAESLAISSTDIGHHGFTPFVGALGKGETCQYGCDKDREEQCPQQRESYGPSHGM